MPDDITDGEIMLAGVMLFTAYALGVLSGVGMAWVMAWI